MFYKDQNVTGSEGIRPEGRRRADFINNSKKTNTQEQDEHVNNDWDTAINMYFGDMQKQFSIFTIKEETNIKEIRMFKENTALEMVVMLSLFLDLREKDIEEVRDMGKEDHSEFSEWLTMNDREEMLKECLARLMYAA